MRMKKAIVVGGSNGIGLALTKQLLKEYENVIIADKCEPEVESEKIVYLKMNLTDFDSSVFDMHRDADALIITAGFGRAAHFQSITEKEIENSFRVNSEAVVKIISKFYDKLLSNENFDCLVMGSIAGLISSPLFSLYAATKASLCRFIESINIELEMQKSKNRILNVSPGSLKGTKFNGGENDIAVLESLSEELIIRMRNKEVLYIPDYETIYKKVLERYNTDAHRYGLESYDYKLESGRMNGVPQVKTGYLSGTFDLFHIGHLNLLKRAKQMCDYLVVGVHKDASHKGKTAFIPYEERCEIIRNIKCVDKVIMSLPEDTDVYKDIKYNYLFVGSDYKGTERFNRYEEFFKDKDVEIVYFPYTQGTSSTQIRKAIEGKD